MIVIGALVILGLLVVVGLILRLTHKPDDPSPASNPNSPTSPSEDDNACCGMHITCRRDSLSTGLSDEVIYYDDEELDRYAGRDANDYSEPEIEQFRDVLLTLLPEDIAGWARSIQLRGITLPVAVKDELLMIVSEARKEASSPSSQTK